MAFRWKGRSICMRVCRVFHRKGPGSTEGKYLLITHSFPHSPQVFPQEFSTGWPWDVYTTVIYIKRTDTNRPDSHFFASRGFYHRDFLVHNFGSWQDISTGGWLPCFAIAEIKCSLHVLAQERPKPLLGEAGATSRSSQRLVVTDEGAACTLYSYTLGRIGTLSLIRLFWFALTRGEWENPPSPKGRLLFH